MFPAIRITLCNTQLSLFSFFIPVLLAPTIENIIAFLSSLFRRLFIQRPWLLTQYDCKRNRVAFGVLSNLDVILRQTA